MIVTPLDFAGNVPSSQATMANVWEVISRERIARYEAPHVLTCTTYDFEFTASHTERAYPAHLRWMIERGDMHQTM